MESLSVRYDGTVRNQVEHIIQFSYGEDGLDGTHVEFQTIPTIKPSQPVFEKKFEFDPKNERYACRLYAEKKKQIYHDWSSSSHKFNSLFCVQQISTYLTGTGIFW